MGTNLGLWIDHGKAFIVEIDGKEKTLKMMSSGLDPQSRYHGGSGKAGGSETNVGGAEKTSGNRRENQLDAWYRRVVLALGETKADRIVILGPGEAKTEMLHVLEKNNSLRPKLVGVETTDQLTENQIVEAVAVFFDPDSKNNVPSYRKSPGS